MNVKECIDMIKRDFSESEIKKIMVGIKIKTPAKPKQVDLSALVWNTIEDNKIRPVLSKCLVTKDSVIGTNLECTVIVPNNDIPVGLYTKQMMGLQTYSDIYKEDAKDYPVIKLNKHGDKLVYDKSILEQRINEIMFALPKDNDNLAINGIRFGNKYITATNSYIAAFKEMKSDVEFTLPKKTCKVLSKCLKASSVSSAEMYIDGNQIEIYIGEVTIKSRLIDLRYANIERILETIITTAEIEFTGDILPIIEKLLEVGKNNPDTENMFILDVKNKKVSAVGADNKYETNIDFIVKGNLEFDKISLNSKFVLDYLKSNNPDNVVLKVYKNDSAVMVNDDCLMMPIRV